MTSKDEARKLETHVKRYDIAYPASAYTYPRESLIHDVRFDDTHLHIDLMDGRTLSIPLWWIPTIYNAPSDERLKFHTTAAGR
jgi:hypothetical protein